MFWDVRGAIMRFIGSKTNLLKNIAMVISENTTGNEDIFCDIFSGIYSHRSSGGCFTRYLHDLWLLAPGMVGFL